MRKALDDSILFILGFLFIAAAIFLLIRQLGHTNNPEPIRVIHSNRDSLHASNKILQNKVDSALTVIDELKTQFSERDKLIKSRDLKIKSYEIKLNEIDRLIIHDYDSAFRALYPDSLRPGISD